MKMTITNYLLRIAFRKPSFRFFALFCATFLFSVNFFAQNSISTETQNHQLNQEIFLRRAIESGNIEQKRDALLQIRNLRSERASRLAVPALTDKSEIVRATATFSVIFLPVDEAFNVLLSLLKDKTELVRREAAYALGRIRNPNAVNPLVQVLQKDKILEVRAAAAIALGEIGDVSAIEPLNKVLQNKSKTEEFLRRSAARSIGQIAQILQTGELQVLTPEDFLPDNFSRIEILKYPKLIETFSVFRPANSRLIEILQNLGEADDVRREAAFALGSIGDESTISALQTNSNSKDYYLAEIAREGYRKIQLANSRKNQ